MPTVEPQEVNRRTPPNRPGATPAMLRRDHGVPFLVSGTQGYAPAFSFSRPDDTR
jgi:hypothetical protein